MLALCYAVVKINMIWGKLIFPQSEKWPITCKETAASWQISISRTSQPFTAIVQTYTDSSAVSNKHNRFVYITWYRSYTVIINLYIISIIYLHFVCWEFVLRDSVINQVRILHFGWYLFMIEKHKWTQTPCIEFSPYNSHIIFKKLC